MENTPAIPLLMPHNGQSAYARWTSHSARLAGADLVDLTGLDDYTDDGWVAFVQNYRHSSSNNEIFELLCFKRYFYIQSYCKQNAIEKFVMCDSDIILYHGVGPYLSQVQRHHDLMFSAMDGRASDHVSPHFSLWTSAHLASFIAYLSAAYASEANRAALMARLTDKAGVTHVSDMHVLKLWLTDRGLDWFNSNEPLAGTKIDHNITLTIAPQAAGVAFPFRAISLRSGEPTQSNGTIRYAVLHFQGAAKRLMQRTLQGDALSLNLGIAVLAAARTYRAQKRRLSRWMANPMAGRDTLRKHL